MQCFLLCSTLCVAFGMSQISYAIVIEMREFQVTEVPPGSELCALDAPSDSLFLNSALECALECQRFSYCESFNYNDANKTCDIFFSRPKCYGPSPSCVHHQVQSDQPYSVGIAAADCSLPFTYDGRLYSDCAVNLIGDGCNFCLLVNRTLAVCVRSLSDNFRTKWVSVNVTVPTFITASLLMSINDWIVIQQRVDGNLSFNQPWLVYKAGFGDINRNFWFGLEKMHQLTTSALYRLRVEVQSVDQDKWFSAEYDSFLITSEPLGYALDVSGYVGDAGDSLNYVTNSGVFLQNGMKFSTVDVDNDLAGGACAVVFTSGFWFNQCSVTCLNCVYNTTLFSWGTLRNVGLNISVQLRASRMMIKAV